MRVVPSDGGTGIWASKCGSSVLCGRNSPRELTRSKMSIKIETEVLIDGFLPFEIRGCELFEDRAIPKRFSRVGGVVDVGSRSRVCVEILVSGVTDREAQLQQVEPFGLAPRLSCGCSTPHLRAQCRREEVLETENRRIRPYAGWRRTDNGWVVGVVAVEIEARAAADPVRVARLVALLKPSENGILGRSLVNPKIS